MTNDVRYRTKVPAGLGTDDESARVVGWRIGVTQGGTKQVICPECTGVDEDYWDRQTLGVAYAAGIDAGNTAWGGFA